MLSGGDFSTSKHVKNLIIRLHLVNIFAYVVFIL